MRDSMSDEDFRTVLMAMSGGFPSSEALEARIEQSVDYLWYADDEASRSACDFLFGDGPRPTANEMLTAILECLYLLLTDETPQLCGNKNAGNSFQQLSPVF